MNTTEQVSIAQQAEDFYENKLKESLEREHQDKFVAIEPRSGGYFFGGDDK
jgi:hypothetical protein